MNVFYEFHKIVQHLQAERVEYALIGGVAVAVHTTPRFSSVSQRPSVPVSSVGYSRDDHGYP
jgi:hypothetical protein